jgi:hypothetical protein
MSINRLRVFLVLLALTICTGALQGAALVPSTSSITLNCTNGVSNIATVTLSVPNGGTAATSVAVTQSPLSTVTITAPLSPLTTAVPASGNSAAWSISEPSGCKPAGSVTLTFTPTGGNTSAVTVSVTLNAPTNSYLSLTGAGSAVGTPLVVNCNAATALTGSASLSASSNATGLTSSNKLAVAVASISATVDSTPTTYSSSTLTNAPVTITLPTPPSFYTGSLGVTIGFKAACSGLSQSSNATTATVQFTSAIGSGTPYGDATLYLRIVQVAPISTSGNITVQCLAGPSSGTPVTPPNNNITISTLSSTAVNVAITTGSSWISLGASSGSPSSASSVALTAQPGTCDNLHTAGQSASGSIAIGPASGAAWSSVIVGVTLQVVTTNPVSAIPQTLPLTYRKGGPVVTGTISVSSTSPAGSYFTVLGSGPGLGSFITADTGSGTAPAAPATRVITFSTTSLNDSLTPGTTTYTVIIHVAGCQDYPVYVKLTVNGAAPVLTVAEGTSRSLTWDPSTPQPSPIVTLVSNDTPIAYSIAGMTGIVVGPTAGGLAFSSGTEINVAFAPASFQSASPGQTLNGTLTITGAGATITIVFNVLVTSASSQANLGAISPTILPTATAGQVFTVNLYGSGFISSTTANYTTVVGLASSSSAASFNAHEPSISSVKVLNSSNITMTITVPTGGSDTGSGGLVNFNQSGSVYIGVCNPNGLSCTPSTAMLLTIGSGPQITSITSSSSFVQFSGTASGSPAAAPYDMISIFGSNFCNSGGTGCGTGLILGTLNTTSGYPVYSSTLSPDQIRMITVNFYAHPAPSPLLSSSPTIAQAPLLFATNNQINALLPGDATNNAALTTALTAGIVDIAVGFGGAYSNVVPIALAPTDPGVFTVGSDGTGNAAVLDAINPYMPLISSTNPAIIVPGSAGSTDWVQIYMTGLGAPDTNDSSCMTVPNYDSATLLQTIDGAVLQPSVLGGLGAPCFSVPATSADVKFGYPSHTAAAYAENSAGWVTIPGLYAVNAQLPNNAAGMKDASGTVSSPFVAPMQVDVTVSNASLASQAGVTMWVAPQLAMAAYDAPSCGSTTWTSYSCAIPAVTGGSSSYNYSYTTLPTNLSFSTPDFVATSAPTPAGSYMISVTATDQTYNALSVTGAFNIYLTDPDTQNLQLTGTTPTPSVYGTANNLVTTVSVTGGTSTYTYTVTSASRSFASVNSSGVVSLTASAPAGSNPIVVHVVDSVTTSNMGDLTFYAPVAPLLVSSNGASLTANGNSASNVPLTSLSALGTTGAVTYTVVQGPTGVAIASDGKTLQLAGGGSLTAGNYSVTVQGVDHATAPNTGFINLSLHIN